MNWGRAWRRLVDAYRRRRWVFWAVAAAVPMAAGWWWALLGERAVPVDAAAAAGEAEVLAAAASAPSLLQPQPAAASAPPPASDPSVQASAAGAPPAEVAAAAAPGAPGAGFWDLCGIGHVPWPAGSGSAPPNLPEHLGEAAFRAGRARLLQALAVGDERARAAGRLIERHGEPQQDDPRRLLETARGTRDPAVAAWLAAACGDRAGCAAGTALAWAMLDRDNGAAWALLRGQTRDASQETQAALQAPLQAATRWSTYVGSLPQTVMRHMPADLPGYVQAELLGVAMSLDSTLTLSLAQPALGVCRPAGTAASAPPPPPGSARQQMCDRIARLILERGDTLVATVVGVRAAELAGWPASAVQALRDDRKALQQSMMRAPDVDPGQPRSCSALQTMRQQIEDSVRLGEVGMLRARAASSPAPGR